MKKHLFQKSLLVLIGVLITSLTSQVWAGYVYLDPSGFTDWYNSSAWFRLWEKNENFQVTTRTDLGNGLWRFNVGDYADGEYYFQRMKPNESGTVWNQVLGTTNGSQNVMKISNWDAGSMQTNFVINWYHNTNEIYFDNSVSNFSGKIYFVIGHDYSPTGSANTYSVAYEMSPIVGTKLYHVQTTAEWIDANYYAIIASSSTISGTSWGSSDLSTKGNNGYTAAYKNVYNIEGGDYLISTATAGNNQAITITYQGSEYSNVQKYNAYQAAKKRDTGTTYSNVSGSWPATLKLKGSYLKNTSDTARSTITSTSSNDAEDGYRKYETIRTGEVTHSYTSLSSSYYFEGWGTGTTPSNTGATYSYNITGNTTTYAFFSKKYALTFLPKGTYGESTVTASVTNYVSVSSGNSIPTGHSITVTATPATGYKLIDSQAWFSDASCTQSLSNGTSTTYSISSLNAASGVYAKFEPITYSITYNLNGGTQQVTPTPATSYNITSSTITLPTPSKDNYSFEGWFDNSSLTGSAITTIASGSYGNKEYWAKWSETPYTVTTSVSEGVGGSVTPASVTDAKVVTGSSTITATPDNLAWRFKQWNMGDANVSIKTGSGTNAITVNATNNSSVEAVFQPRYGLHGSLSDDSNSAGMPGWEGDGADFTVEDFDAIGEGDGKGVDLECARTLQPNKQYKFRIQDREAGGRWGYSSSSHVLPAENPGNNIKLSTYGDVSGKDVLINTVGYGSYTFKITNMYDNGDGKYYPAIEVERVASSQLTLGWKHYTAGSLETGNIGGTVSAITNEGSGFAITNGQFYANGSTLTFTASPETGYNVEWFNNADCAEEHKISTGGNYTVGVNTLTVSSVSSNLTIYAKFSENSKTYTGAAGGNWTVDGNWSGSEAPTINDVVYIDKPVIVDGTSAKAKRVIIYNDGDTHTGKLTVNAGKKLVVAQTIKKNNGSALVATSENDLVINSDGTNGVGALVWGEANTTPGEATVNFYSISGGSKNSTASVNQFIGTPFTSETSSWLYNYYNSWVLGVDYTGDAPAFYLLGNEAMDPFKGYCIIYNGSTGHTYEMTGTLVTNANHTCSSLHNYDSNGTDEMKNENLLANPWLAPIRISKMKDAFSSDVYAGVYIFTSTSEKDNKGKTVGTGNYTAYTPGTAGESDLIPSMQSFSVFTTGGSGSVTLDYSKIVYVPASEGTNPIANKAPKRVTEEEANKVRLFVDAESGYGDQVYMWERSDFNEGYDRVYDGHKIYGDKEAPQFYAQTPDGKMSINCVPTFEGTVMGFKAGTADNTYTFSFEYNNEDDALYLYDIDENKYTRVLEGNTYTFSTTDKTEHNRFILTRNMPQNPTGIENKYQDGVKAVKFLEDGKLFILRSGKLYDATGALVK